MRHIVCLVLAGFSAFAATDPTAQSVLGKAPLRFESVSQNAWMARSLGFGVAITDNLAAIRFGREVLRVEFAGGRTGAGFSGEEKSATPSSIYSGHGFTAKDAYLRLRRTGIYPGIDAVFYGVGQSLEYDFDLAPGADPTQIRMRFDGAQRVRLTEDGSLALTLSQGEITQKAPVTYQRLASGEIVTVPSRYRAEADGSYSVSLGVYEPSRQLVIDPQLLFTAYLSGSAAEGPISISRDKNNSIYVVGYTSSDDFPLTGAAYSGFLQSPNPTIFTSKLNPLGSGDDVIPYSGYFGGDFGDTIRAAVVDSEGVLYMTGYTDDFFFPDTPNAYKGDNDETRKMFVAALDTKLPGKDGLKYATFFGGKGTEEPTAIALGPVSGQVYITGFTNGDDYPVKNAIQDKKFNSYDGFVAAFDITKSGEASLLASTYLGGSFYDIPRSITVDAAGKAYITGYTFSYDFPTTPGSFQPVYAGGSDVFLTKLDLLGKSIEYSTFIGGSGIDQAWKIALDAQGRVALGGFTLSTDYPRTPGAFQTVQNNGDAFLSVLDVNTSQMVYSTLYGGSDGEVVYDMRIGPSGYYYLGGYTLSRDLPIVDALRPTSQLGGTDGFVAIVNASAPASEALIYSSYVTGPGYQVVQGIEVDPAGNVYVTGQAYGNVFEPGQATVPENSNTNVFLFVFRPSAPLVVRQEGDTVPRNARERR